MDLFTTCVKLAGGTAPADRAIDGIDIAPLLVSDAVLDRGPFFYYRGQTLHAVRIGPWKIHYLTRSAYGPDQAKVHSPPLLFHLGSDPGEKFDVAAKHPQVLAQAARAVEQHRATLRPAPSQLEETIKK